MFDPVDFLWLVKRQEELSRTGAGTLPAEVIDELQVTLEELSFAYAGGDPEGQLSAASDQPGYLMTECGNWQVFVHWPLATSFPGRDVLAELLKVGMHVAVPPAEAVCLSGSSAALGHNVAIGDVDFCQYVTLVPAEIVDVAVSFTAPGVSRVLIKAQYGNKATVIATAPKYETWGEMKACMHSVVTIDCAERFMVEFLGRSDRFGILPVSNVILASDFLDRNRGAASQSFVFQEAVAVPRRRRVLTRPGRS